MPDAWQVTVRLTPPLVLPRYHPWQVDEVQHLRTAGATVATVAVWASTMWCYSVTVLTRHVARRRN